MGARPRRLWRTGHLSFRICLFVHALPQPLQSFFLNTYTGSVKGDTIAVAPALPGDIAVIELQNESLLVQPGSYLASSVGIEVDTKWSGAKTFFGSEG